MNAIVIPTFDTGDWVRVFPHEGSRDGPSLQGVVTGPLADGHYSVSTTEGNFIFHGGQLEKERA